MARTNKKRAVATARKSTQRKSPTRPAGQQQSGFGRWLDRHPVKLIYGSVMMVLILSILSVLFVARSNAAAPTATTTPKKTTAATAASCGQARIQKLVNSVSEAKIKSNLQILVQDDSKPKPNSLGSRYVGAPGNKVKVAWAKKQLKSYGLTVVNQRFKQDSYSLDNVVGRLDGSNPKVLYAAGAHIDSINGDSNKSSKPAPGANDDGSGVVAMMEAARVLKPFKSCMKSSIDFVGFNMEETSEEWGSDYYVKQVKGKKTFKGLYNMDMIGYAPKTPCMNSYYNKSGRDKSMASLIKTVNTKYKIGLTIKVASYDDDDHAIDSSNFWEEGLASAYLVECDDNDPGYHSPNDTLKNINYTQITKTTKAVVAALAELSSK